MSVIIGVVCGLLLSLSAVMMYHECKTKDVNQIEEKLDEISDELDKDVRRTEVKRDQDLENRIQKHIEDRVKKQNVGRNGYDVDVVSLTIEYNQQKDEIVWVVDYEFVEN